MTLKSMVNFLISLQMTLFIIFTAALLGLGWAGSVEARVARQTNYGAYPEDDRMKADRAAFQKATQGEHRLARMERLAHDYAYGQGADQNWNNKKLRRRMNVDQFDIVETIMDDRDGTAAMVVRDRVSNRNVIVFRGTDGLLNGLTDPNPDAATDAAETAYAQIGQTQYAKHAKLFNEWADKYGERGQIGRGRAQPGRRFGSHLHRRPRSQDQLDDHFPGPGPGGLDSEAIPGDPAPRAARGDPGRRRAGPGRPRGKRTRRADQGHRRLGQGHDHRSRQQCVAEQGPDKMDRPALPDRGRRVADQGS